MPSAYLNALSEQRDPKVLAEELVRLGVSCNDLRYHLGVDLKNYGHTDLSDMGREALFGAICVLYDENVQLEHRFKAKLNTKYPK